MLPESCPGEWYDKYEWFHYQWIHKQLLNKAIRNLTKCPGKFIVSIIATNTFIIIFLFCWCIQSLLWLQLKSRINLLFFFTGMCQTQSTWCVYPNNGVFGLDLFICFTWTPLIVRCFRPYSNCIISHYHYQPFKTCILHCCTEFITFKKNDKYVSAGRHNWRTFKWFQICKTRIKYVRKWKFSCWPQVHSIRHVYTRKISSHSQTRTFEPISTDLAVTAVKMLSFWHWIWF